MQRCYRILFISILMPFLSYTSGSAQAQATIKGWGTFIDPLGDCSAKTTKGHLVIHVPGTLHDLAAEARRVPAEIDAPRVLSIIANDFRADVRVLGSVSSGGDSTSSYFVPYHGAGLLLRQDDLNYVRLERASYTRGTDTIHYINFELRKDGENVHSVSLDTTDEPISLRLERIGNSVHAYASQDGISYWKFDPINVTFPDSVMIGVDAVNTSTLPFDANFDRFHTTLKRRRR